MATCEEVDVIESWEQIEESGILDQKLMHPDTPSPDESELMPSRGTSNGPVILQEDGIRTHYIPPQPTVKILKRPARNREQEYAEARLRILGEARSPEEQLRIATNDRISKIQTKMEVLRTSETSNIIRLPKGPDGTRGFNVRR
ncbi:hypothetical protein L9F63_007403 [Diploptera punctata]|uniref:SUZ-C domain-containing protein n=1 Tax=Diploptera punctata TaxID=6984 RepID=A0AAD8E3Z5_DIPPU|nr:hypothetical protein L9F63_007403 [Diploptera punctata]